MANAAAWESDRAGYSTTHFFRLDRVLLGLLCLLGCEGRNVCLSCSMASSSATSSNAKQDKEQDGADSNKSVHSPSKPIKSHSIPQQL